MGKFIDFSKPWVKEISTWVVLLGVSALVAQLTHQSADTLINLLELWGVWLYIEWLRKYEWIHSMKDLKDFLV